MTTHTPYRELLPTQRQAAAAAEDEHGPDAPATLDALSELGRTEYNLGKFAEDERRQRRVEAAREASLGPEHPETLTALCHLAEAIGAQGRADEAEKLARTALEAAERTGSRPAAATAHLTLGWALTELARPADALPHLQQAIDASEPRTPRGLAARSMYATALRVDGQTAAALESATAVLADRQDVLGPQHLHTLTTATDIALLHAALGTADDDIVAEARRTLHALEETVGTDHPQTAACRDAVTQLTN